jgi:ribonuclease D
LLQIAIRDSAIYLVDPEGFSDPSWSLQLAKPMEQTTWILHAATQDLPCLAELGLVPGSLVDTELAARLAGLERFGLASLAETLLEIELAKEHSAADWSQRPLPESMLRYAALDVDVLFEIWDALEKLLTEQGKSDWARQEFEHLTGFKPKPTSTEPWRQLPGMSKVKDQSKQKIAAALWEARNRAALEKDVAPGRLIPDRSIAAVVAEPPKTKSELASNKQFQGRASRSMLDTWWKAIAASAKLEIGPEERSADFIPNHRSWEKRFPEAHARLSLTRPLILEKAQELELPVENLLTPDVLRRVCFEPDDDIALQLSTLGAREWQIGICAALIDAGFGLAQAAPKPQA